MRRLSDIGMHCGCDYTNYQFYQSAKAPYTRLIHSIGVSNIVWNFTHDIRQSIAGLFHDIATPVFAHTIDFMQGDHLAQESTEDKTLFFIENSKEITALLKENHICIEDISDYHKYPIADNDTPKLSADRLEYTIGNAFNVYSMEIDTLSNIYRNLTIAQNEHGTDELCFQSIDVAKEFSRISLRNSYFFVSDEDRFAMQYLADIIRFAIDNGILLPSDLYLTENEVIQKLNKDKNSSSMWKDYTELSAISTSMERLNNQYCVNVTAKKRYINPLVLVNNHPSRLTDIDLSIRDEIQSFLNVDFNKWISVKCDK